MSKRKFLMIVSLVTALVALSWGAEQAGAQPIGNLAFPPNATGFNAVTNYNLSNFAYTSNIRKFVDSLPGLGAPGCTPGTQVLNYADGTCNQNNLGQYIPLAIADKATYPGDDFYNIAVGQYSVKMHSDLPPTTLRGYYQVAGTGPGQTNVASAAGVHQYLGAMILARSFDPSKAPGVNGNGGATRILFQNNLPTGIAGNLFLPVDTTLMGAGMGPTPGQGYTQNRAVLHLHGGLTPWISDGTPHQWITPAGQATFYPKGDSFQNVPDMIGAGKSIPAPSAGDGLGTYYYTNQQSSRLMFYHDHAYGITRLNVYAGMAAGYLLVSQTEDDMIDGTNISGAFAFRNAVLPNLGGIYRYGVPLVIQDRTFVNDATTPPGAGFTGTPSRQTLAVDPLWQNYVGTGGGNFWFPHEYMPNENIYDPTGVLNWGRWDYGPWLNPPTVPFFLNLPSPSHVAESFMDTMVINGTALPYVNLPPQAVRFRILNACNDRSVNLQFYVADPSYAPGTPGYNKEVKMVPASAAPALPFCAANAAVSPVTGLPVGCTPTTWPTDGRNGGVPDPALAGPKIIQIGSEGGILPQVAEIPSNPVGFEYNRRVPTMLNVTTQALLLMPAERTDIIVDFSAFAGKTLILYNDGPAPMPLFDERNETYTNSPDWTAIGGTSSVQAGFGPNNRTIMQVNVGACPASGCPAPFDLAALQVALPQAYKATQAPPIVPQAVYNAAFGTNNTDTYVTNIDATVNLTGTTQPVSQVIVALPGSGFTTAPNVTFVSVNGFGSGAAATACLNGVSAITVTTAGAGYTNPPAVTFTNVAPAVGTGAAAVATLNAGGVSGITMTNFGCNYTVNPTVNITAPPCVINTTTCIQAAATANVTLNAVGAITVTNGGSGYTKAPLVFISGGGGLGATADAMLNGDTVVGMKNITEGFEPWYGRINVLLGTTPVLLDPLAPAPQVPGIATYIDPPSDIFDDGKIYVWRLAHLGVDSHIVHYHLGNLQVVNRVDFTDTTMPPTSSEVGWKESIRTNPFTDLILAWKQPSMWLPFQIPRSSRLMDVTTLAGSTANYIQPAPVAGLPNPAGIVNAVADYGWEYVWHCHLLGHEENDMMRPLVFNVTAPSSTTALASAAGNGDINLTWPAIPNANTITIERATNSTFTAPVPLTTFKVNGVPPATTFRDTTVVAGTRYYYRITAANGAGVSVFSNTVNRVAAAPAAGTPAAPTNLTAKIISGTSAQLTWTNNANNETGFVINRSVNGGAFAQLAAIPPTGIGAANYTDTGLKALNKYRYEVKAVNGAASSAFSNIATANLGAPASFSGSGKTDISVFRAPGSWLVMPPGAGAPDYSGILGAAGDIPVPGDYDGDAMTDFAVFRPSTGAWIIVPSSTGVPSAKNWGIATDIPVPGDYDGDGKTDLAVFRPAEGNWYILPSSTGVAVTKNWGISTDKLVPGDYDGDGKTDYAVFRPAEGNWYILPSSTGVAVTRNWGIGTDVLVPGDYDGDGKTDFAVFRPTDGNWYILPSSTGVAVVKNYGISTDVAAPGDYDGDGKTDFAVFRPAEGKWYINPSSTGIDYAQLWGNSTDTVIPPLF